MTIAPWGVSEGVTRACFRSLRTWRDKWAAQHPRLSLAVLSMGMSGDFPIAIEEGATRIRVGTALFGKRPAVHRSRIMLRATAAGVTLAVRAQPVAKKSEIVGVYGERSNRATQDCRTSAADRRPWLTQRSSHSYLRRSEWQKTR